ncbi:hypothetical protein Q5424_17740 [Conexibacter sp. JD483]|uniref:hypothetical protein n=1 Tax=unclassified Conexibacter TaxID=2627773 RepID=UPI00272432A4|nr:MULTISPECIES: hypothetical protein [unclassified Conexibacter]MDO8188728.1 hypothetical protein [Conexibacter sp. CPCC 205706]MDO8201255.1 hypothetical protein [Conexibacter sp. CPCC 205762]MDR9370943.1 hypothetical protein [Conexibacter sp. JD483]
MARRPLTPLALLAALLLCLAGCGGGGDDGATGAPDALRTTPGGGTTTPGPTGTTPGGSGARSVDARDLAVVRAWAATLQRGDVAGAARFFALPSAVANGTRPVALQTRAQARAFNRSLPCGADVISARPARDGFFIVTFRLTERPGGACGSGTGNTARAAFHVSDGLIDHWLRVEDLEGAPAAPGTPT